MKNVDPEHISLTKFGPVAYLGGLLRFLEPNQASKFSNTCTVASFPVELHTAFISAYIVCERCVRPTKSYWWKPLIQFSGYDTVDTTNVLSSYFMTVDMHRFAFLWLVYSRNKFFRMGPKNLFQGEQGFPN